MNEVPNILEKGESIEWDDKPKYAPYMIGSLFVAVILFCIAGFFIFMNNALSSLWFILAGAVCFGVLILAHLNYKVTHYVITGKRIIIQKGIIGRDFKSVDYDKMINVSVDVGILGVIFKVGTIMVNTGETTTTSKGRTISVYDQFSYIPEAYEVLKLIQTHLSKRKESLYGGENVVQKVKVIK